MKKRLEWGNIHWKSKFNVFFQVIDLIDFPLSVHVQTDRSWEFLKPKKWRVGPTVCSSPNRRRAEKLEQLTVAFFCGIS